MNSKPGKQLWLSLTIGDELGTYDLSSENPTETMQLMERIVAPENLRAALRRVQEERRGAGRRRDDRGRTGRIPERELADDPRATARGDLRTGSGAPPRTGKGRGRHSDTGYTDGVFIMHPLQFGFGLRAEVHSGFW